MKQISKSNGERGSALLIVFVMAAAIAIMLYMELPISAFEAQRNKEQLLIDRGNEYAHAAKLYFRKVHQFPPTLDAMENTNRLRFLRKRYKDPFTGKDDWRLLHAAPNGMVTDSKVNPISNNNIAGIANGNSNANNQNAGNSPFGGANSPFNSSSSSGFGGFNTNSASSSTSNTGETVVPSLPQRRPAVSANPDASDTSAQGTSTAADTGSLNAGSWPPAAPLGSANPNAPQVSPNGQAPGSNGTDPNRLPAANQNSATTAQGASPFRLNPANSGSSSSRLGVMQGGGGLGIAGVASIAKGHSIKTVNDQEDYSLWEFYYDPNKDRMQAAAGALAQMGGGRPGASNQSSNPGIGSSSSFNSFGGGPGGMQNSSNSFNNSFGQQGRTNNSFGSFGSSNSSTFGSTSSATSSSAPANPSQQ